MENKFLVVANLKMNMLVSDVASYLDKINKLENKNLVVCPTSIYTPYFLKKNYKVGLQNIHYESEGAYTGEISPLQASKMGIEFALVGHSERRIYFGEDDVDINKKILECLKNNIKVILCIGETNEEKDMMKTSKVLKRQLMYALRNVEDFKNIYIAYEPVWSIGTNIIPASKDLESAIEFIKNTIYKNFDTTDIKVLYGGSINEENIKELKNIKNIDGFLIGKSSCDADKLISILNSLENNNN